MSGHRDPGALRASFASPLRVLLVEMLLEAPGATLDGKTLGRRAMALPEDVAGCLSPLSASGWLVETAPGVWRVPTDVEPSLQAVLDDAVRDQGQALARRRSVHASSYHIVGDGPRMKLVFEQAQMAARTDVPVLVTGETGTGKDLVARAIHQLSARAGGPYVGVNVAALPGQLIESELFGHERGAFTGARRRRPGKLVSADGGTLFLDEIGELPVGGQVKLLRAIQERRVLPIGASREVPSDFRLVTATHRDLHDMVRRGGFRDDLLYRINVLEIRLPALRERPEDIPALTRHFLDIAVSQHGLPAPSQIAADAIPFLARQRWPGNVRQLESVVYRVALIADGAPITARLAAEALDGPLSASPPRRRAGRKPVVTRHVRPLDQVVQDAVVSAVERHGGNISAAARELSISRVTLYRHLRAARGDALDGDTR